MQKNKLLVLVELFRKGSDAAHPLTTQAIIERLAQRQISCDRKTLGRDIRQLREAGYPVQCVRAGHSNAYYLDDQEFSLAELKILMDAVQAATFITQELTDTLTNKLTALGGPMCSEALQHNQVCFNIRKQNNPEILQTVSVIEDALRQQTQITFLYFKHAADGTRSFQREGARYTVDPISLIYTDDHYYLRCYNPERRAPRNYRIDRMTDARVTEVCIGDEALVSAEALAAYTARTFKMFGGREETVTLEFSEALIDVVFDQFGMETVITPAGNGRFRITETVGISSTFWSWLCQFPDDMTITAPETIRADFRQWVHDLYAAVHRTPEKSNM